MLPQVFRTTGPYLRRDEADLQGGDDGELSGEEVTVDEVLGEREVQGRVRTGQTDTPHTPRLDQMHPPSLTPSPLPWGEHGTEDLGGAGLQRERKKQIEKARKKERKSEKVRKKGRGE